MRVGKSTIDKWVRQIKQERNGVTPQTSPITPEQVEIQLARLEDHNGILKRLQLYIGLTKQLSIIEKLR